MRRLLAIRTLLADGWTTAEIAEVFGLSERHVRRYRTELRKQLGEAADQSRRYDRLRAEYLSEIGRDAS